MENKLELLEDRIRSLIEEVKTLRQLNAELTLQLQAKEDDAGLSKAQTEAIAGRIDALIETIEHAQQSPAGAY